MQEPNPLGVTEMINKSATKLISGIGMGFDYSSSLKNYQDDLAKFTVKVSLRGEDEALGTGILVTDDGLIATCYHVIKSSIKSSSSPATKRYVSISFSGNENNKIDAEILEKCCTSRPDIAILKIDKVPSGRQAAKLGKHLEYYIGHRFESSGYRKNDRFASPLPSNGRILSDLHSKDYSSKVVRLDSTNYGEEGMSGSAVLDAESRLVVAMMMFHDEDEKGVDHKAPYAIPVSDIVRTCPEIEKSNRGLIVYEFLNLIQSYNNESYKDIDHLWVAPSEYEKVKRILDRDGIVIITGPPEYGKTYTAIRILWEYYCNKGYLPILFDMEDRRWHKAELQEKINQIISFISENNKQVIVYLNDPFGKTDYVDQYIDNTRILINSLRKFKDSCRLMITSREKNFENVRDPFMKEIESIVRFDISKPSYDTQMRERILLMHAENSECVWAKDITLTKSVLDLMRNKQRMLPTLLNIFDFVQETVHEKDFSELEKKMSIFSEYTPIAFAKEIKDDYYDLMEFLSFPFISNYFETEFVRSQYEELIKDKPNRGVYEFEKVAEKFKDKISSKEYVRFRHPSYSEALPFVLESNNSTPQDRQKPNWVLEGFSMVISKLANNRKASYRVAEVIVKNYTKLPKELAQDLISKLAEHENIAVMLAIVAGDVVAEKYNNLPKEIAHQLLMKLAESGNTDDIVAEVIVKNYTKLPKELSHQLLMKLAESGNTDDIVAEVIIRNYDDIPKEISHPSLTKVSNGSYRVAEVIVKNYTKLPKEITNQLLMKLAESGNASGEIAGLIIRNYDELPKELSHQLLMKLAESGNEAYGVSSVLDEHFDDIPKELSHQLLMKLAERENTAYGVSNTIVKNYTKLPKEITHQLLMKLAERENTAYGVSNSIINNYTKLPKEITNQLLMKLAESGNEAYVTADVIAHLFDELPKELSHQLLMKLAERENTAYVTARNYSSFFRGISLMQSYTRPSLAEMIVKNYTKLPKEITNQLLMKLAESGNEAYVTADVIAHLFDELPKELSHQLLMKLAESGKYDLNAANSIAEIIDRHFDELPKEITNQLLMKLAESGNEAYGVSSVLDEHFDDIPKELSHQLLMKLAESGNASEEIAGLIIRNYDELPKELSHQLLMKLAGDKNAANALVRNYTKLPKEIVYPSLIRLAGDKEAARMIAHFISEYFYNLPKELSHQLLMKLAESGNTDDIVAEVIVKNYTKLPKEITRDLNSNSADDKKAENNIADVIDRHFDELPKNIVHLLLIRLAGDKEAARMIAHFISEYFYNLPLDIRNQLIRELKR